MPSPITRILCNEGNTPRRRISLSGTLGIILACQEQSMGFGFGPIVSERVAPVAAGGCRVGPLGAARSLSTESRTVLVLW